nr:hypothetical protein [Mycoplasmopsis bovis]
MITSYVSFDSIFAYEYMQIYELALLNPIYGLSFALNEKYK